jgi:gamma-glutamylcyclotransferase
MLCRQAYQKTSHTHRKGCYHMHYFAYGSNMLHERLQERVPSARPIAKGQLSGFRLAFHKRSNDESGKGDIAHTDNSQDRAYGVVFDIDPKQEADLDRHEGLGYGYEKEQIQITMEDGAILTALTYRAMSTHIDASLRPYTWYRDLVLYGARQNGLADEYIQMIEDVETWHDSDPERERKNRQIIERATLSNKH